MKKFYLLTAFLFSLAMLSWGQTTVFSEDMGSPSGTTAISSYTGWQNAATLSFTDGGAPAPADVRSTSASSGYAGASGSGNIFFTSSSDRGFAIEGINASSFSSLTVQFGYRKESGSLLPSLALDYWDGAAWQNVPFAFSEAATDPVGWYLSPAIILPAGAQINGLKLRWVKTGSASTRLDDVVLSGITGSTPTLVATGSLSDFGNVAVGTASSSQSFDLSGANLTGAPGNITITAPAEFEVSNNNTSWAGSTTVPYATGTLAATPVYLRFAPQSAGLKTGNLTISGGGATPVDLAVGGTGFIPAPAAPVATAATTVNSTDFTANWNSVAGATGYRLDVYTLAAGTVVSDIAGWNFATNTAAAQTADIGNANNAGIQTVTSSGLNVISWPSGPSGASGSPNPYSVSGNGWDNGDGIKYWQIDLNTTGASNLTLSSLQGSSNTGPSAFKVQYMVGASGTWTDVPGGTVTLTAGVSPGNLATWGAISNLALPSAVDNQPLVSLRWISTSNTAVNGSAVSATGTSRISAIYVKGDVAAQIPSYVSGYQDLAVGNVTSQLVSGLTANTTYYYVVRAENAGGSSVNSNEIMVTTANGTVPTLAASVLAGFGNVCINTTGGPESFTINGTNLTTANVTVGPLAGFSFSTTSAGTYTPSLALTQPGGTYSQQVFVQFDPTVVQSYDGAIPLAGGGAAATTVAVTASGVDNAPTVTAGAATAITATDAILPGAIADPGCTAVSAYGVEYSTTAGFANGTGTVAAGSNLSGGNFSVALSSLSSGITYYYKAYATNSAGTSYSSEQSFTTGAPSAPSAPVATAATVVGSTGFTANWNAVAGATNYRLDVYTLSGSGVADIAGWNFATNTAAAQTADLGNANNIGIQTVSSSGLNTISWPSGPSGSSGSPNPYSVSGNGWDNGMNVKYWQIDVNTTGATNLTLSSLQGSSNTGPASFKVQYMVGASGTWTDVAGGVVTLTTAVSPGNLATWGAISNLALPSAVDNQPLVSIRWLSTTNTAVNGSPIGTNGTSRISAIYVQGITSTGSPVYVTGYQDLSVGNVTSYNVTGLTPGTTYYYVVRAENSGGASPNSNVISVATPVPVVPTIVATTLNSFGNTCVNTTAGPESFTINGTNLTSANITVGPLAGYSFSTTAGGSYTADLTLTHGGGTFTQQVFVQFNPTAIQSYNGNIPVSGGGVAATVDVPVTGSGVDAAPAVTTGGSSAVTDVAATLDGTIADAGCTAISAYGIEYSTTAGFANGTGTQVAGAGLTGGNFSAALSGLTANTTYYYKAYATNAAGTSYGSEQSFTTLAFPPVVLTASALTPFGTICVGTEAGPNSFIITGSNLTTANVTVGPLAGYSFSTTAGGSYSSALSISQPGGAFNQTVYVKFSPSAGQSYNGNIPVGGGGATAPVSVPASGSGDNTAPTAATGGTSAITTHSVVASGDITSTGCSAVTDYGIEYSGISNFIQGTGTKQSGGSGAGTGVYSVELNGLVQGATYYYRAYATNSGGTAYGPEQSFTVLAIPNSFTLYPVPVSRGQELRFSMNNLKTGYVGIELYNNLGQQVYRKHFNIQNQFINDRITVPHNIPAGIYSIRIVNDTEVLETRSILIVN